MKSKRKIIIGIAAVIAVVVVFWIIFFANGKAAETSYRFAKIDRGNLNVVVTATGTLSAVITVDVGTQVSGIISKLFVDFNDHVRKGQVIAMIDTTFLEASVQDADASLEKAKAQVNQAKRDLNRTQTLFDKQLDSQMDLDNAQTTYEQAVASYKSAKAQYDRAVINLKYATIKAPIQGVIINRAVDVGQTVAASLAAPTIYTIANDLTKMQVKATIDETNIGSIVDSQLVSFTVDAYPERIFRGIVSQIRLQPQTIQNVVNYTVVIDVPNPDLKLMPGMTATVNVLTAKKDSILLVPNMALRFQPSPEEAKAAMDEMQKEYAKRDTASTVDAQRDSMRAMFRQRFAQTQNGSANGTATGQDGQRSGSNNRARLWYVDENKKLKVAFVRTGITNGTNTEITLGSHSQLKEGMEVIIGTNVSNQKTTTNPLGGQQQQSRPGPRMF